MLARLRKENALPFIDFALSDYLLKNHSSHTDLEPLLIHLSQATRAGHLCVKVTDHEVIPKPADVWMVQENFLISPNEWLELEKLIQAGAKNSPETLVTDVNEHKEGCPNTPLCRFDNLFYFQKYWISESTCLQKFFHLLIEKPLIQLDASIVQQSIDRLSLLPEQAQAIKQLEKHALTIIYGGPGTGKTYTAGLLVKVFWQALSISQRKNCKVALAAPTGKAASNLQKSLGNAVADLEDFPQIKATTLHSLLNLKAKAQTQPALISADLLVIDECSMIDIRMMSFLLGSLKPGARLIMLGDPFQLPPIEPGAFFSDMIHHGDQRQMIELHKCLRMELKEILDLATEVKKGTSQAALHLLNTSKKSLYFHHLPNEESPAQIQRQLLEKVLPYLSSFDLNSPESINRFRILSPLRKGALGVDQLNAYLYKEILKKSQSKNQSKHPLVIPIMIIANSPKQELFNGDVGFLIRQEASHELGYTQIGDYAIFSGRKIPALLLPQYEYSYCLSIHKCQGSEFDHVLLLLPEGSEHFSRELIYTGVTRTRQQLEIWSTPLVFDKALNYSSTRLSRSVLNV